MKPFNYHTASIQVLGDLVTPVSAYLRVRDDYPQSVLMESSDYHANENAKSYIALHPIGYVSIEQGKGTMRFPDGEQTSRPINEQYDATHLISDFMSNFNISGEASKYCGLYGYTAYDAVRYFEHIPVNNGTAESGHMPELLYILYKDIIVFDHYHNEVTIIELLQEGECDDLEQLKHDLLHRKCPTYEFHPSGECTSTITDDEHRENIRKGIKHCLRGDVFQIVLSRRFKQRYNGDDFQLYRALRSVNPSPYLFYFDFGEFRIFGSSPETHCRIESHKASIDPIAGTTRRTGNTEQDRQNALYLRNDAKENAEHVMLVDLARNDLSRNCHNVRVEFFKDMQYYSHVIHLVSRVSGDLDEDAHPIKAFVDTFPAGTLSGAPKVRAMQLINDYEPHSRGAYGGCIGFIGLNGNLNQAITIRTFVSQNNELCFQAGSGIVAKSDVEYELQEVNNKLGALRKAIDIAEHI